MVRVIYDNLKHRGYRKPWIVKNTISHINVFPVFFLKGERPVSSNPDFCGLRGFEQLPWSSSRPSLIGVGRLFSFFLLFDSFLQIYTLHTSTGQWSLESIWAGRRSRGYPKLNLIQQHKKSLQGIFC